MFLRIGVKCQRVNVVKTVCFVIDGGSQNTGGVKLTRLFHLRLKMMMIVIYAGHVSEMLERKL